MKWIYLVWIVILLVILLVLYFQNVFMLASYWAFFFFSYVPLPFYLLLVILFSFWLWFLTSLFLRSLFNSDKDFDDWL